MSSSIPYLDKAVQNIIIDLQEVETGAEPFDLTTAKEYLRITFTDDDNVITALIKACRKAVEDFCNITIVNRTITLTADLYYEFELPIGPIATFTSASIKTAIATYTAAVANTDYEIDGLLFQRFRPITPGRYKLVYNTAYPSPPDDLMLAIKQELAFRFENRGDAVQLRTGAKPGICEAAEYLATPYRRMQWL